MDRRDFAKTVSAGAASLAFSRPEELSMPSRRVQEQPNILFIMADDHAANAVGSYGSRLADITPTANIDRIAREGIHLENCFCTNSICAPSRAAILTGQYSHRNNVYTLRDSLDPDRQNVAKLLQQNGYQTALVGKWHLKEEPSGFDYWNVLPGQGRYHDPVMNENGTGQQTYSGFVTDVITDLSLDWLDRRDPEQPFCLMTHFKNCHGPWEYAERYSDLYTDATIPEPPSLWEDKRHRSSGSREFGYTMESMAWRLAGVARGDWPTGNLDIKGLNTRQRKRKAYQRFLKDYLRCVAAIDENVGRLLDYLDEHELTENTVVVYTSDQGYFLGEHDYIDKRWMFEESLRMPCHVRYPAEIPAGSTTDDIILNSDLAPTFLDYAGAAIPELMQGESFRSNLSGNTPDDWRTSMYYRYWMQAAGANRPAHYGIRTDRYKLIFYYGLKLDTTGGENTRTPPGWELYDLERDPYEVDNVYSDPAYTEVVDRLKEELLRLKRELGDTDEKYPELMKLRDKYW